MSIIARFIALVLIIFYIAGCKNANTSQAYQFASPQANYTIQFKNNALTISSNGATLTRNKATLVVFLDIPCEQCRAYYEHLNHLLKTHKSLYIVGILTKIESKDLIAELINENKLDFEVIMPTQEFDVITYFLDNKPTPKNQLTFQDSSQQQKSDIDSTQLPPKMLYDTKELPFFMLYNTQGQFYEDYQGIVPEEIFSSDIAQILQ